MTVIGNNKRKAFEYFFEFIVLFASIYIAFELEEWDEDSDFTDREIAYLASMHQDLSKDFNQLNRRIIEYDEKINSAYNVLELLEQPYASVRADIQQEFKLHLFSHFNYNPINNTIETLKTSGDLKLVKNHGFKILLSELDKSYVSTVHQGEIFNDYIEGMEWSGFFINHFDMSSFQVFDDQGNFSILFRNRVRHYISLVENYYFHMQGSLKKTEEVKLALEREMSRRNIQYIPAEIVQTSTSEKEWDDLNDEMDAFLDASDSSETPSKEKESGSNIDAETDDLLDELNSIGN